MNKPDPIQYNAKAFSAPRIRSDGQAIEFQLITEDGQHVTLIIPTTDVLGLADTVIQAVQTAKTRGVMLSEVENPPKHFEPTPLLVAVDRFGFVTQPKDDIGYLLVQPTYGRALQIRFDWPQLRRLVAQIQRLDNIQTLDSDSAPN